MHSAFGVFAYDVNPRISKCIYDIVNKTGYEKFYVYSEKTNQLLRYQVLIVTSIFAGLIIYGVLCEKMQYCG